MVTVADRTALRSYPRQVQVAPLELRSPPLSEHGRRTGQIID
jgi:hypothetical protein